MKRSELARRTPLQRGSSRPRRSQIGHASAAQKAKVELQGPRLATTLSTPGETVDPAHVVPRGIGGCDHEDCVIGLRRADHRAYDRDELDVLPYLTLDEQAHAASHLGLLGALKRTTGDTYLPQREGVLS
jgi:hypothetical protein